MAAKQTKVSKRMLLTWLTLGGLILFLAPSGWTSNFQFAFLHVFNWPLSVGRNISLSVGTTEPLASEGGVQRRQYDQLRNHCRNLEAQLAQKQQRIEMLTGLHNRDFMGNARLVEGLVYSGATDKVNGEISIYAGDGSELRKGQFVLADNCIIGTISDVSPVGARVKLLTSPTSNIAVQMGGAKGLLRGSGGNLARIPMMKQRQEVGVEVIAVPQAGPQEAGLLNTPIIVGRVLRCERNVESAVLWDIVVEPAFDIDRLNDVVVIVMDHGE
jgi:cell shape-determining protein MreC